MLCHESVGNLAVFAKSAGGQPATSAATMAANLRPTLPGCASAMARDPRSREHYVMKSFVALSHPAFGQAYPKGEQPFKGRSS